MGSESIYLAIFLQVAEHDDNAILLLPDHPPEVAHRALHGSLSGYEVPPVLVPLKCGTRVVMVYVRCVLFLGGLN